MLAGPQPLDASAAEAELPSEEAACLKGHDGPVLAVRFNPAGTYCLTCGKDRSLRLWNPHRGIHIKTYNGHGYDVRDVDVSTDNSQLVSCGGDRQIFMWDVATGRIIRKFRGHDGAVNAVRFGAAGGVVVSGGYDQAVRLWDCRSRSFEPLQTMKPFADSVTSVIAPNRPEVVAGSVDGTVRRFDVRTGLAHTDRLASPVTCVAASHDGNCLLAATLGSALRLLDRQTGEPLASYAGHVHGAAKLDCAVTASDAYVVCGSEDGRVCFWDLVEETLVHTLAAHAGVVTSLAAHPQGACLLTAGTDGAVKVWR